MKNNSLLMAFTLFSIIAGCSPTQVTQQNSIFKYFDPDTVQSYKFDTGKMWTLEDLPTKYFQETYDFLNSLDISYLHTSAARGGAHASAPSLPVSRWATAAFPYAPNASSKPARNCAGRGIGRARGSPRSTTAMRTTFCACSSVGSSRRRASVLHPWRWPSASRSRRGTPLAPAIVSARPTATTARSGFTLPLARLGATA